METYSLHATRRSSIGKIVDHLRRTNRVPAVMYGHGMKNQNLDLDAIELMKTVRSAGTSSLVDLSVEQDAPVKVLIHAIQYHPTRSDITHVDFYQVKMTEKLETDIDLEIIGESPAIKEQGGILVRALDKVKVSCLPSDLVHAIQVDISVLKTFEDKIRVADLKVPHGIEILDTPDTMVAVVNPPRSEAELASLTTEVTEDVAAIEVEKKGKEEPAEGETEGDDSTKKE